MSVVAKRIKVSKHIESYGAVVTVEDHGDKKKYILTDVSRKHREFVWNSGESSANLNDLIASYCQKFCLHEKVSSSKKENLE